MAICVVYLAPAPAPEGWSASGSDGYGSQVIGCSSLGVYFGCPTVVYTNSHKEPLGIPLVRAQRTERCSTSLTRSENTANNTITIIIVTLIIIIIIIILPNAHLGSELTPSPIQPPRGLVGNLDFLT